MTDEHVRKRNSIVAVIIGVFAILALWSRDRVAYCLYYSMYGWSARGQMLPLKVVLTLGVDPVNRRFPGLGQPLIGAVRDGRLEAAKLLIEHGADVNVRSKYGVSPLEGAVMGGSFELCRLLIAHGAEMAKPGPEGTALMLAANQCRADLMALLVANGANLDARPAGFPISAREFAKANCDEGQ